VTRRMERKDRLESCRIRQERRYEDVWPLVQGPNSTQKVCCL
jgi:hypothetical protein